MAEASAPVQPPPYRAGAEDPGRAADTPLSSSAMSVDGVGGVYDAPEKLTVKIADLGNGTQGPSPRVVRLLTSFCSYVGRTPLH